MAKKKNQSKKHRFKYADPAAVEAGMTATSAASEAPAGFVGAAPTKARQTAVAVTTRDFSYVSIDLARIAVLAVLLVGLELVLWLLFTHTGVGSAVYSFVKV